jgi:hypothetical protein
MPALPGGKENAGRVPALPGGNENAGRMPALPGGNENVGRMPALPGGKENAGRVPALPGEAVDVLDTEGKVTVFREPRIRGANLHGSGCMLSAAIAAGLGNGMTLEDSVGAAKSFVLAAIRGNSITNREQ